MNNEVVNIEGVSDKPELQSLVRIQSNFWNGFLIGFSSIRFLRDINVISTNYNVSIKVIRNDTL